MEEELSLSVSTLTRRAGQWTVGVHQHREDFRALLLPIAVIGLSGRGFGPVHAFIYDNSRFVK
jgi:hypothetical protein